MSTACFGDGTRRKFVAQVKLHAVHAQTGGAGDGILQRQFKQTRGKAESKSRHIHLIPWKLGGFYKSSARF